MDSVKFLTEIAHGVYQKEREKIRTENQKDEIQSIKPLVSSQIRLFLRLGLSLFLYLLPLPLVIFAFKRILHRKNQARIVMSFSKPLVQQKFIRFLSFIPEILQGLCLFFVILALASPYKKIVHSEIKKKG